jgi:uncharacterized membrane protein
LQVWQGQFPPPEAIEHYERVLPGAFNRIIAMAERQQNDAMISNADARNLLHKDTSLGLWLGWSVTIVALVGALICAALKQPVIGCALVAVPVMSVGKALIESARANRGVPQIPQPPASNPQKPEKPAAPVA